MFKPERINRKQYALRKIIMIMLICLMRQTYFSGIFRHIGMMMWWFVTMIMKFGLLSASRTLSFFVSFLTCFKILTFCRPKLAPFIRFFSLFCGSLRFVTIIIIRFGCSQSLKRVWKNHRRIYNIPRQCRNIRNLYCSIWQSHFNIKYHYNEKSIRIHISQRRIEAIRI